MKVNPIIAVSAMLAGAVVTGPAWATPVGPADLTITNSVPPGTVSDGQTIDYFITVSNIGGVAADGTAVTDLLPSSVSFLSAVVSAGSNVFSSSLDEDIWTIGTQTLKLQLHLPLQSKYWYHLEQYLILRLLMPPTTQMSQPPQLPM